MYALRESLSQKFTWAVLQMGEGHMARGLWEKALDCFYKGIDIHGLSEGIYQKAMVCCGNLGRKAEAASVFRQCQKVLSEKLGITPSDQTVSIYLSLTSTEN